MIGIHDLKLRERLLRETALTLEKGIKLYRIKEQSKEHSKVFISPAAQTGSIDAVKRIGLPVGTGNPKNDDSQRIVKCKFCASCHAMEETTALGGFKSKNGIEERRVRHVKVGKHKYIKLLEGLYTSRKFKVVLDGTFSQIYFSEQHSRTF